MKTSSNKSEKEVLIAKILKKGYTENSEAVLGRFKLSALQEVLESLGPKTGKIQNTGFRQTSGTIRTREQAIEASKTGKYK